MIKHKEPQLAKIWIKVCQSSQLHIISRMTCSSQLTACLKSVCTKRIMSQCKGLENCNLQWFASWLYLTFTSKDSPDFPTKEIQKFMKPSNDLHCTSAYCTPKHCHDLYLKNLLRSYLLQFFLVNDLVSHLLSSETPSQNRWHCTGWRMSKKLWASIFKNIQEINQLEDSRNSPSGLRIKWFCRLDFALMCGKPPQTMDPMEMMHKWRINCQRMNKL